MIINDKIRDQKLQCHINRKYQKYQIIIRQRKKRIKKYCLLIKLE